MCELLAMSSLHAIRLTFSLETLAAHGAANGRYRDGWGVAFYQGPDVALFREPTPAGDSALIRLLESSGPESSLVISHIRRATHGDISLANTQPFIRQVMNRTHVFAHNGNLPGIEESETLVSDHFCPVGTTDSEYAACALFERMQALWKFSHVPPTIDARLFVITGFAAELKRLGPSNFMYADGDILFTHADKRLNLASGEIKPPGLFLLSRQCQNNLQALNAEGVSVTPGFHEVILVASSPLSEQDWQPMAEGEIVAIACGKIVGKSTSQ